MEVWRIASILLQFQWHCYMIRLLNKFWVSHHEVSLASPLWSVEQGHVKLMGKQ